MPNSLDEELIQLAQKVELESLNQKQRKHKIIQETTLRVTKEAWIKQQGETPAQPQQQRPEEKDNDREDDDDQKKDQDEEEDKEDEDEEDPEKEEGEPEEAGEEGAGKGLGEGAAEGAAGAGAEAGAAGAGAGVAAGGAGAGAGAGAAAASGGVIATAPVWGTALLILAGIVLVLIVVMIPVAVCKSSYGEGEGVSGKVGLAGAKAIFTASGVCSAFQLPTLPDSPLAPPAPIDLVSLIGLADVSPQTADPRARQCMARKVADLFNKSKAQGLAWVVTSAYRPGATTSTGVASAHARGEAIDISLVPQPAPPWSSNQKIKDLLALAKSLGFTPPAGDTLDEYNNPNEQTTGGHIHIEYNLSSTGSFCDLNKPSI